MQKLKNVQKYAKICDTPSLIHREAWFPGGPRIPKNPIFLKNGKTHPKRKNSKKVQRYAKISDTAFDQRSLIHRQAWFPGGPRIPQNQIFLKNRKIIQNVKTQKRLDICQNQRYTLQPVVSNPSESVVSTMFCKAKSAKKTFFARQFLSIFKQKCSNLRPLLSTTFPQGFQISKKYWTSNFGKWGQKDV